MILSNLLSNLFGGSLMGQGLLRLSTIFLSFALLFFVSGDAWENQAKFEKLDAEAKREMVRKLERFKQLPSDQKAKLIEFHQQLVNHPDSKRLQRLLTAYRDWTLLLTDREQAELKAANIDNRAELIQKFRLVLYERMAGRDESSRLSKADAQIFLEWIKARSIRMRERGGNPWVVSAEELDDLSGKLSKVAKDELAKAPLLAGTDDGRIYLVRNWMRDLSFSQPSDQDLRDVYESLSAEDKGRIQNLKDQTPEAIREQLTWHYRRSLGWPTGGRRQRGERGPGGGAGGGPPNGRPSSGGTGVGSTPR